MPPRVKKMSNNHKVTCGCKICIYASMMKYELNTWVSINIEKLRSVSETPHPRRVCQQRNKR